MIWFLGNLHSVGGKDSRPPTTSHTQDSEYLENYDDNAREDESDDDAGVLSQVYPPPAYPLRGVYKGACAPLESWGHSSKGASGSGWTYEKLRKVEPPWTNSYIRPC